MNKYRATKATWGKKMEKILFPRKANKYRAKRTQVGDLIFDSQAEARRYAELLLLIRAGTIRCLELQPKYRCIVNGQLVTEYRADFRYFEGARTVVEDVKGFKTKEYQIKKRLVEACFPGVEIVEVSA